MFWKKKNNNPAIEFSFETDDKRGSYRTKPLTGFAPVALAEGVDKHAAPLQVRDISTGGFSFYHEKFKKNDVCSLRLRLPTDEREIHCKFQILSVDEDNIRHCRFLDISSKAIDIIYHYVLEVQKREIRLKT